MRKYRYVIGVDPSGNFFEGKGTTGLAVYDTVLDKIVYTAYIQAQKCETQMSYWLEVIEVIKVIQRNYSPSVLSIEDYILYSGRMESQINSTFETSQLIGVLKYEFRKTPIYIRPAVRVKTRWSDEILLRKGYLHKDRRNGFYYVNEYNERVQVIEHCRDAIRHAIHCGKFEVGKEKK